LPGSQAEGASFNRICSRGCVENQPVIARLAGAGEAGGRVAASIAAAPRSFGRIEILLGGQHRGQRAQAEASRRLPDGLKARHPSIAWKQMAGAGHVNRHDYEDVAAQYVWETVQRALPPLQAAIEQELKR
jgi:hypothetical protein